MPSQVRHTPEAQSSCSFACGRVQQAKHNKSTVAAPTRRLKSLFAKGYLQRLYRYFLRVCLEVAGPSNMLGPQLRRKRQEASQVHLEVGEKILPILQASFSTSIGGCSRLAKNTFFMSPRSLLLLFRQDTGGDFLCAGGISAWRNGAGARALASDCTGRMTCTLP